jgi:hypothetical protein
MAFPATYNFNYYRGDSFEFIIYPKNSNGETFNTGTYDSTLFTIATNRGEDGVFVGYGEIVNASTNLICKIAPSLGDILENNSYVYDIEIGNTDSNTKYTLLTGTINITQDVSGRALGWQ